MQIEEIPTTNIIYMRRTGAYGSENQHHMETFKEWLRANNLFNEKMTILGIARDDPKVIVPEKCRYDVGLVVNKFADFNNLRILKTTIQTGKYVIFTVEHTDEAAVQFWQNLFEMLNESGLFLDAGRPIIERYQYKLVMNHLCEFCVPIQ